MRPELATIIEVGKEERRERIHVDVISVHEWGIRQDVLSPSKTRRDSWDNNIEANAVPVLRPDLRKLILTTVFDYLNMIERIHVHVLRFPTVAKWADLSTCYCSKSS